MTIDEGSNNVVEGVTDCKIHFYGSNNRLTIHPSSELTGGIVFFGNNCSMQIGSNSRILSVCIAFQEVGSSMKIGEGVNIYEGMFVGVLEGRKLSIGNDCLFSKGVCLRTGDSHKIYDLSTGERVNSGRDITIGNHVWLGERVFVLKGADIGNGCMVGAVSTVTGKKFPDNCVIAGSPAKVTRRNIKWEQ